jgi:hypothetical protein
MGLNPAANQTQQHPENEMNDDVRGDMAPPKNSRHMTFILPPPPIQNDFGAFNQNVLPISLNDMANKMNAPWPNQNSNTAAGA